MPGLGSFRLLAKPPSAAVRLCHPAAVVTVSPEGKEHFSFQKLLSFQGPGRLSRILLPQ